MALFARMAGAGAAGRWLARGLRTSAAAHSKVAVVLSGCGVYDGSEIHEASACLVHLSRQGAEVDIFAPDLPQMHVVNHLSGEPTEGETRNVLVESARIARGNLSALGELNVDHFDALVLPGGFGAAKNLCSYAVAGEEMEVNQEVGRILQEFRAAGKPIGLCCISPVMAAKVFPGVEVTVGSDSDPAAAAIVNMGGKHVPKPVTEAHTDENMSVVTVPAYMYDAPLHQVFDGIGQMISGVMKLIK